MRDDQATQTLTIGQLAAYVGVTIKAIRHYHRRDLLPEPPRDAANYRRYGAQDAIALIKIRTLAEAGVPLARIKELLAADAEQFAVAIAEIDHALQQRVAALLQTRERIAQLHAGDTLLISPVVADYLDRLRELGVSARVMHMERELWMLMHAVAPIEAASWIASKRAAIDDPEFCALYLAYDAAFDWAADDPRLDDLAARTEQWFARGGSTQRRAPEVPDPTITQLVANSYVGTSPAWARLAEISRRR